MRATSGYVLVRLAGSGGERGRGRQGEGAREGVGCEGGRGREWYEGRVYTGRGEGCDRGRFAREG